VALSLLRAGASLGVVAYVVLCVAARFTLMSCMVAPGLRGGLLRRFVFAQLVVDETWALAYRRDRGIDRARLIGSGLVLYVAHVGGTLLGAAGAGRSLEPGPSGLDAALPALFLVLVWPHLDRARARGAAALSAAVTLILTPFAPAGVPVVAGACVAFLLGRGR
jgi:predicted branched-subunit amino acid permease